MCAKVAAQAEVQRIKGEQDKDYAALRAQHNDELAKLRDALAHAKSAAKSEMQDLKDRHKEEQERLRGEHREREKEVRAELQDLQERHSAEVSALKDTHAKDVNDVRQEEKEASKTALDRRANKDAELQKFAQMHREEVKELQAEVAALRYANSHGCFPPIYQGLF